MPRITRRTALVSASGAVIAAAGIAAVTYDEGDLIRDTLHEMIGPFVMADEEMDRFKADFMTGQMPRGMAADAVGAVQALGLLPVATRLPGSIGPGLERFRRTLFTSFVLGTTYLDSAERPHEPLSYLGMFADRGCANPFARFD